MIYINDIMLIIIIIINNNNDFLFCFVSFNVIMICKIKDKFEYYVNVSLYFEYIF
jgi:hypothetical protein